MERPQYPWQIPVSGEFFYQFEAVLHEEGCDSELVYDEHDVFRFADGRFALSREHADWAGLIAIGYFEAWRL